MATLDGNLSTVETDVRFNRTDNPALVIAVNTGVVLNFLLNVPVNVYVIWFIIRASGARNPSNVFMLQLSMSEVVMSTGALLVPLSIHFKINALQCASFFFLCMMGLARPFFQTCICMEHYLAVIHPVLFQRYKPLRYKAAASVSVWVSVLGLCLIPAFGITRVMELWCIVGLPLFLLMLLCSLNTLRVLRHTGPGDGAEVRVGGARRAKMRAFYMIVGLLAGMTPCYGPLFGLIIFRKFISAHVHVVAESIFMLYVMTLGLIQPVYELKKAKHPCCC